MSFVKKCLVEWWCKTCAKQCSHLISEVISFHGNKGHPLACVEEEGLGYKYPDFSLQRCSAAWYS